SGDSILLDTTLTENILTGNHNQFSSSNLGYDFCKDYILPMKSPEIVSIYHTGKQMEVYPNDVRMEMTVNMVDANYWRIFDFEFIEGRPFGEAAVENQSRQIILTSKAAREYFGIQDSYAGRELVRGHETYEVIGVVREPYSSSSVIRADAFLPLTLLPRHELNYDWGYFGGCGAILQAPETASRETMAAELRQIENNTEMKDGFDAMTFWEKSVTDLYAWPILGGNEKRMGRRFMTILTSGLVLFLLIPTINLINLNTTRILERSSEIGIRKAFGARTDHLFFQFLLENILLTLLGGVICLLLTFLAMQWFNAIGILEGTQLRFNYKIFFISLLITVLFGILSGLIPARKMARKEVAEAIKISRI